MFFDLIVKKPVTDLAISMEAFCLSGVDGEFTQSCMNNAYTYRYPPGVVGKLVKHESQLRGEVVSVINEKLRTFLVLPTRAGR